MLLQKHCLQNQSPFLPKSLSKQMFLQRYKLSSAAKWLHRCLYQPNDALFPCLHQNTASLWFLSSYIRMKHEHKQCLIIFKTFFFSDTDRLHYLWKQKSIFVLCYFVSLFTYFVHFDIWQFVINMYICILVFKTNTIFT